MTDRVSYHFHEVNEKYKWAIQVDKREILRSVQAYDTIPEAKVEAEWFCFIINGVGFAKDKNDD